MLVSNKRVSLAQLVGREAKYFIQLMPVIPVTSPEGDIPEVTFDVFLNGVACTQDTKIPDEELTGDFLKDQFPYAGVTVVYYLLHIVILSQYEEQFPLQ